MSLNTFILPRLRLVQRVHKKEKHQCQLWINVFCAGMDGWMTWHVRLNVSRYFSWSFPSSVGFTLHLDINPLYWIHLEYPSSSGSGGWHITAPCQPWYCSISANHFLFWFSREATSSCFLSWTLYGSSMLRPVKTIQTGALQVKQTRFQTWNCCYPAALRG